MKTTPSLTNKRKLNTIEHSAIYRFNPRTITKSLSFSHTHSSSYGNLLSFLRVRRLFGMWGRLRGIWRILYVCARSSRSDWMLSWFGTSVGWNCAEASSTLGVVSGCLPPVSLALPAGLWILLRGPVNDYNWVSWDSVTINLPVIKCIGYNCMPDYSNRIENAKI